MADFADFLVTDDQDGIVRLCTLFGALVLSRATNGSPLSGETLAAARGLDRSRLVKGAVRVYVDRTRERRGVRGRAEALGEGRRRLAHRPHRA